MSILQHTPAEVQAEWHTDEPTPLDILEPPVEADCPCERESARYVVGRRYFKALGRSGWEVRDRAEDRLVYWSFSRRACEDKATDLNAEDWPDCGDWWRTVGPFEGFDTSIKLALPSQARADKTIDRLGLVGYPPF